MSVAYSLQCHNDLTEYDFKCPICLNTIDYHNSVQDNIGHLFCTACILQWLNVKWSCPLDRHFLTIDQLKPLTQPLKRLLAKVDVYCQYGCNQMFKTKYLKQHEENCTIADRRLGFKKIHENVRQFEDGFEKQQFHHIAFFIYGIVTTSNSSTA